MLQQLLFFTVLFFLIFFISKSNLSQFHRLIIKIIGHKHISVWILALIFLPGTVIHELSHFVAATILHVPTGKMSIFPTIEKNGEARAGHIMVARTDPFRLSLIGLAPMMIGLTVVYLTGLFLIGDWPGMLAGGNRVKFISGLFLLFQTTSGMFSSKSDLKSFLLVLPVILLFLLTGYFSGLSIQANQSFMETVTGLLTRLNFYLLIASITDYFFYLFFLAVNSVFGNRR
ncbi:MAG: hypothetical protein UV73_C0004G0047 [Candidatus Gottesmanbacteria bacterium GW2011_GWA2_43_14]|uniref:Uncharacterized protein n=1 Tax=Candidatus Gottesmanbacteria bacterium GW2011_GWA2_43_14 TaxID=1618443 RepID=A0A0G1DJ58_9BACT|nr:MAG: hypothetical protein UV73_C0004G0047 [Candidatus Gottesmanbacteria bacterium GW2011_GWA2_43_14]